MNLAKINKEFRSNDESHLWPICGRFNATERAIKKARKLRRECPDFNNPEAYRALLDSLISGIVNDPKNQ